MTDLEDDARLGDEITQLIEKFRSRAEFLKAEESNLKVGRGIEANRCANELEEAWKNTKYQPTDAADHTESTGVEQQADSEEVAER